MNNQYVLKNYMLELVEAALPKFLETYEKEHGNAISSPKAIMMVKAETLNRLPAKYITSKVGEVYGEYNMREMQNQADLTKALYQAAEVVLHQLDI
ncbi:MAG: late competence development ComFB family protein [Oscillospiraceae bacterium]